MNPHPLFLSSLSASLSSSSSGNRIDAPTAMRSARARALARRRGRLAISRSIYRYAEPLEERRLLTTIHGGDTFEFRDANMQVIRVHVAGPTTARVDLVGATMQIAVPGSPEDLSDGVRDDQFPLLNDIP